MYEISHISHSQIEMWDRCPKQWEYKYISKVRGMASGTLLVGGVYHKALEWAYNFKLKYNQPMPFGDLSDMLADYWDTEIGTLQDVVWGKESMEDQRLWVFKASQGYLEDIYPRYTPARAEYVYTREVDGTYFVCIVDLECVNGLVVDHKTTAPYGVRMNYDDKSVSKSSQPSAIAFAMQRPIEFEYHLAVKTTVPSFKVVDTIRTKEDIEWYDEKVRKTLETMRAGLCPPNTDNWTCNPQYCDAWALCRGHLYRG